MENVGTQWKGVRDLLDIAQKRVKTIQTRLAETEKKRAELEQRVKAARAT